MKATTIFGAAVLGAVLAAQAIRAQEPVGGGAPAQDQPVFTFKASVDLVRVAAIVRDRKGRFVKDLAERDFQVVDGGINRKIADFRHDASPITLALLFDVSGSMESRMGQAREAATHVLNWLDDKDDEAAVYTFDTRLEEVRPFSSGLRVLPEQLSAVKPFGATSLHDAIARTAERVGKRNALRRAVVVFTDGQDTASKLSPSGVSALASAIDVPVFVIGIVPSIDNPSADISATSYEKSPLVGPLGSLAAWTGGQVFVVSTIADRVQMARQLIEELRQQYLIAFEASTVPGWHSLEVRVHDRDMNVRARSGYIAGQSSPTLN